MPCGITLMVERRHVATPELALSILAPLVKLSGTRILKLDHEVFLDTENSPFEK